MPFLTMEIKTMSRDSIVDFIKTNKKLHQDIQSNSSRKKVTRTLSVLKLSVLFMEKLTKIRRM